VQDAVRDELWKIFEANPANAKHPQAGPAKMLRLAFHDCVKYADGSGGCDGCLNWDGMRDLNSKSLSLHFDTNEHFNMKFEGPDAVHFGLEDTVVQLEQLYAKTALAIATNRRNKCKRKKVTLKDQRYSRADLWAFAALKAVEFSVETNNKACVGERMRNDDPSTTQCLPNEGEPNCRVLLPPLTFMSGRQDCTPESDGTPQGDVTGMPGYVTFKKEIHPHSHMNGSQVVEFMNAQFNMNSIETVALMGVHTIGRFHHEVAGFKYVWSSRSEGSLNNQFYRNLALKDDWMFYDDQCNKLGGAWGEKPKAKWMAKVNKMFTTQGPVQWIKESHTCPNCAMFNNKKGKWIERRHTPSGTEALDTACCENLQAYADQHGAPMCKPDNARIRGSSFQDDDDVGGRTHRDAKTGGGCERFKFVGGRDHAALSSDVGLYMKFDVDEDGFPVGCGGTFDRWTLLKSKGKSISENSGKKGVASDRFINARFSSDAVPHSFDNGQVTDQPCQLNDYQASPSEPPLFSIVDYFADHQAAWIGNFTVALEKMLSNGQR
jgi:hypothetical protein